ncbi:hypothetical protein [uncultured Spongiibacter sp.]|uniref:hypothetical protein n=1 Tax=uncultured Spongiibacter sp. TaxID=870896 RepID=UPI0025865A60|nr:hypothetical protein [uncultured Spongiibacter sp.]
MPREFKQSTAELTVVVAEAVYLQKDCEKQFIQDFCDLSPSQADSALFLASDIGLISENAGKYSTNSPLTRLLGLPSEISKAAILRTVLECYEPFINFRNRLVSTGNADDAAEQTKVLLDLDAHREEIKDTLISLGTYTNALSAKGGGIYEATNSGSLNQLKDIAQAANELAEAEASIRIEIGSYADSLDRTDVIIPLARALLKAKESKPKEAVTESASALESYLAELAGRLSVNLTGATGLTSRIDKFRQNNDLPKKICESGKYLGQIRNAADHGVDIDQDVGSVWKILPSTGRHYVFVACAFIRACGERERGQDFWI